MVECNNYYRYIVDGDGRHEFKKYMQDDPKLSSAIKVKTVLLLVQ